MVYSSSDMRANIEDLNEWMTNQTHPNSIQHNLIYRYEYVIIWYNMYIYIYLYTQHEFLLESWLSIWQFHDASNHLLGRISTEMSEKFAWHWKEWTFIHMESLDIQFNEPRTLECTSTQDSHKTAPAAVRLWGINWFSAESDGTNLATENNIPWLHMITMIQNIWRFPKIGGTPNHSNFSGLFHCKPSSCWGTPIYWNPHIASQYLEHLGTAS